MTRDVRLTRDGVHRRGRFVPTGFPGQWPAKPLRECEFKNRDEDGRDEKVVMFETRSSGVSPKVFRGAAGADGCLGGVSGGVSRACGQGRAASLCSGGWGGVGNLFPAKNVVPGPKLDWPSRDEIFLLLCPLDLFSIPEAAGEFLGFWDPGSPRSVLIAAAAPGDQDKTAPSPDRRIPKAEGVCVAHAANGAP